MTNIDAEIKKLQLEKLQLEIENIGNEKKYKIFKNWDSLELTKIIISLILPIILVAISITASSRLRAIEKTQDQLNKNMVSAQENNKRIYELRFNIYQKISIQLNEIYSYCYYVGKWKELTPIKILEDKRFCDEIMYSNQSLFSRDFFEDYLKFINAAFQSYTGPGKDAKLFTDLNVHEIYYKGTQPWRGEWRELFSTENGEIDSSQIGINKSYDSLRTSLSKELSIDEIYIENVYKDHKPK